MFKEIIGRITSRIVAYSLGMRLAILFLPVIFISAMIALFLWAIKPEMEPLFSDLSPENATAIIDDLKTDGVKYETADFGKTILVPSKNAEELRLRFNAKGIATQKLDGYNVFDENKIGMTSFMQKVNMKRALEGELMRTINQFPEVKHSRVHLNLPEDRLFESEEGGSASLVLYLEPGAYISKKQGKAMAILVANSVKGVEPSSVSIIDSQSNVIYEETDEKSDEMAEDRWEIQKKQEEMLEEKVTHIMDKMVGKDNSTVKVTARINFDSREYTEEIVDPDLTTILSENRQLETSLGADSTNFSNENILTNYEVSKKTEHFISGKGVIERLTVAVMVNGRYEESTDADGNNVVNYVQLTDDEIGTIESLVRQAVGFDNARGDEVEVANVPFNREEEIKAMASFEDYESQQRRMNWLKNILMVLPLLVGMFMMAKLYQNSIPPELLPVTEIDDQGITLQPAETAMALLEEGTAESVEEAEAIDGFMAKLSPEARARMKASDRMTEEVLKFATEQPEAAANLIKAWIAHGDSR